MLLAAANIVGIRLGAGSDALADRGQARVAGIHRRLGSLAFRLGNWGNFLPFADQRPGSAPLPAALAGGMIAAFFSFGGWWDVSKIAGEIRDPVRTLPRALTLGDVGGDLRLHPDYDGLSLSRSGGARHIG